MTDTHEQHATRDGQPERATIPPGRDDTGAGGDLLVLLLAAALLLLLTRL